MKQSSSEIAIRASLERAVVYLPKEQACFLTLSKSEPIVKSQKKGLTAFFCNQTLKS
jgi:hypothetical protein